MSIDVPGQNIMNGWLRRLRDDGEKSFPEKDMITIDREVATVTPTLLGSFK